MSTFNEFYIVKEQTDELFNSLTTQEKIFVYFLFRAALPFNNIARDQNHRYSNEIIQMFEYIYTNKNNVNPELLKEIKTYLVYLWVNHGVYFMREHSNNKRTPNKLGMTHLTETNLRNLLLKLNYRSTFEHLMPIIFDDSVDSELVVDGSIDKSGNNYYGPGFTQKHYDSLSDADKNRINAYPELDKNGNVHVRYHSVNDKYGKELTVTVFWLKQALKHAKLYPANFDEHIIKSLALLIEYFETGDENKFKEHSVEWLKTNSRLDYTMGFIEQYHDPMGVRGEACGEVTVKTISMEKLNPVLLEIEKRLPIPNEFKKLEGSTTIMNVSSNKILHSAGHNGPQVITAAYCLPNYNDIRSEVGSKQILYKLPKSVESSLNPDLAKEFRTKRRKLFVEKYDPNDDLYEDLWDAQVLLHETIGHSSGALDTHTFTSGENLTIQGKTYKVGDTLKITDGNYAEFIKEDSSSLEELRAEINALYMSIAEMDVLDREGVFKDWVKKIGKEELKKECIIEMCRHSFRRYLSQGENMTDITGAHARANVVITNYLLEGGGIKIIDEVKNIDGNDYHLLDIEVIDSNKAFKSIVDLLQTVQRIKSTGDTNGCKKLFEKYVKYPIDLNKAKLYRSYMLANKQKLVGNIKATSRLYPNYVPILQDGNVVDVISYDMDIFEQNFHYRTLMLSTDY